MRLDKDLYNQRILQIIGACLRFVRNGGNVAKLPVSCWITQYGFTHNFSKKEELTAALKDMLNFVEKSRFATGKTPSQDKLVSFVKERL